MNTGSFLWGRCRRVQTDTDILGALNPAFATFYQQIEDRYIRPDALNTNPVKESQYNELVEQTYEPMSLYSLLGLYISYKLILSRLLIS